MSVQTVLAAGGSHLYPGATGSLAGGAAGECLVEFADGSAALGRLMVDVEATVLETEPYVTARGTAVSAKRWIVEVEGARFRIRARSQAG